MQINIFKEVLLTKKTLFIKIAFLFLVFLILEYKLLHVKMKKMGIFVDFIVNLVFINKKIYIFRLIIYKIIYI